jgi:Leucine-rich repeat (LRR) protein
MDATSNSGLTFDQNLQTRDLSYSNVVDVSALAQCQNLHTLDLSGTQVVDVSALAQCPNLQTLDLSDSKVVDVSALAQCQNLQTLHLSDSKVVELGTPLLTPDEMEIVKQIDINHIVMDHWHCGTSHCLAGWAETLCGALPGESTEECGRRVLPSLQKYFLCSNHTVSVREMLTRLQATV